jgi:orotidine-5'-phosphate decarboxylase
MSHGELGRIRSIVDDIPIFVTSIGTQGKTGRIEDDDVREIIVNGRDSEGYGIAVCSSRAIIFSPNPQQEALRLHHLINRYRKEPTQKKESA